MTRQRLSVLTMLFIELGLFMSVSCPSVDAELSQMASKQSSQDTENRIRLLLEKRGLLPSATTIRIEVQGSDYESDTKSTITANTQGWFRRVGDEFAPVTGHDGKVSWTLEATGFSRKQSHSDRDISIFLAWFRTGQWLDRVDHSQLNFLAAESDEHRTVFSVTHSRATSKVCFSNDSGLAEWFKFHGVQGAVNCSFSNYEKHFGISLPCVFRSESTLGSSESKVTDIQVVSGYVDFSKPDQIAPRIRFVPTISERLNVRRTPTGHVVVDVVLNEGVVRKFIFDTGAGATVVHSALAQELALENVGQQALTSVFGTAKTNVYRCDSLQIGPATLENPRLVSMDLTTIRSLLGDEKIDGIIGFDLLSQCVCEIELASDSICLFDEPQYTLTRHQNKPWEELTMLQNVPLIEGKFPRGEGIFRMDVGAASGPAGNLIFHTPTVERCHFDISAMQKVKSGESEFAVGPLDWFELGGHRFERPLVLYSISTTGPLAEPNIDGNMGVEFLKVFRLILDYRNARMALMPIE